MIEQSESQRSGSGRLHSSPGASFERARRSIANVPDPGLHLHAPVSTVVHVETVLGLRPGRVAHDRPVAVAGSLHLPELRCEIAIRGHAGLGNGSGNLGDRRATATIIPRHFEISIPAQCLDSPMPPGQDLWVLTPPADGDPSWIEHYAGQLDGEPLTFDCHVPVDASLDVTFTPEGLENAGWSNVSVVGELRFLHPTRIRLLFRDAKQSMAPSSEAQGGEVVLIAAGSTIPIRQTMPTPARRDAWLTVRVIEAETRTVCLEQLLSGRTRNSE